MPVNTILRTDINSRSLSNALFGEYRVELARVVLVEKYVVILEIESFRFRGKTPRNRR